MKNDKKKAARSDTTKKKAVKKPVSEEYRLYQRWIRSKAFKELRSEVLERDGYTCAFCGRTIQEIEGTKLTLQCHHRSYVNVGKGNEEEKKDLITVCSACHRAAHNAPSNRRRFTDKHWIIDNMKNKEL